jgi:hypothetical protein
VTSIRTIQSALLRYAVCVATVARGIALLGAASISGLALAAGVASAATPRQTVTLGGASGNPTANICAASINCTYVPFSNVSAPALGAPFNGTVTSFAVNAGSAGGRVKLRVLRPTGGGKYTGVGTSVPETLNVGMNTFTVSMPVEAGDVIGLDNDSSALMFDTTSPTAVTAYYELPPLADGASAAPGHTQSGYRLLLSATVQPTAPQITNVGQSHRVWREGSALATFSREHGDPIGTTFSLPLNEPAQLSFAFSRRLTGRLVGGTCRAQTSANRSRPRCPRSRPAGTLRFAGHSGVNQLQFDGPMAPGKRLAAGRYAVRISAVNAAEQVSNAVTLLFTIVK